MIWVSRQAVTNCRIYSMLRDAGVEMRGHPIARVVILEDFITSCTVYFVVIEPVSNATLFFAHHIAFAKAPKILMTTRVNGGPATGVLLFAILGAWVLHHQPITLPPVSCRVVLFQFVALNIHNNHHYKNCLILGKQAINCFKANRDQNDKITIDRKRSQYRLWRLPTRPLQEFWTCDVLQSMNSPTA